MSDRTGDSISKLKGQPAWIFSDGKAGHESQCLGVASALGLEAIVKRINPTRVSKWAAPWGPVGRPEGFGKAGSAFGPPWPVIALATGRTTIPYIRALKRRAGAATFTVVLMDPRTGPATADLIWVPEHDRLRGANVIRTLTAPHRFSRQRLDMLRAKMPPLIAALPSPRVAVLVGGPNGDYRYGEDDIDRLVASLASLRDGGAGLMVTPSRRTPENLKSKLVGLAERPGAVVWDGAGENPYADFLAHADAFVITADSVSMTCEAATTGKPIYAFMPSGKGGKFARFHAALARHGATRPLPADLKAVEAWSYDPLDSAGEIADEIALRFAGRAQWLSGLVGPSR